MKTKLIAIALMFSAGSAFASAQAHYGDAVRCIGTAITHKTGAIGHFSAVVGEQAPNQFMMVDADLHYSFLSPEMGRDPRTGGYIGVINGSIYRANYLPNKDVFDIISNDYTFTAECKRP